MKLCTSLFILFFSKALTSFADSNIAVEVYGADNKFPKIHSLNWLNQNFLEQQRNRVDKMSRSLFGQQIRGNKTDLRTLQRLIDSDAISAGSEKIELQALGVVLGDIYTVETQGMEWRVYEDELGKSHAICLQDTKNCLFPVTMLSRRLEAGVKPNVNEVFQKGLDEISPFLPKKPFSH